MLLQPRKFRYKNRFKLRSFTYYSQKSTLRYGHAGLIILKSLRLKAKQITKFKIFLKRATKRSDKTQRFSWINLFPHLPLTRKPKQSRMGKGKGKMKMWFINLRAGTTLLELRNLRYGRSIFFLKKFQKKLHGPSWLIKSSNSFTSSNLYITKKVRLKMYW